MKLTDENIVNMVRELSPKSEVQLLRSWKGKKLDWKNYATFTLNGSHCWVKIDAFDDAHYKHGAPGVLARVAKLIEPIVGKVSHGVHNEHRIMEQTKRGQGRTAHWLEFAMKSAGSSDKEIYEALKYA